jgi:hypothetical protein
MGDNKDFVFEVGDKVRLLDSLGEGTVKAKLPNGRYAVVDADGMEIRLAGEEIVLVLDEADAKLTAARPKKKPGNLGLRAKDYKRNKGEREVIDLHLKGIPQDKDVDYLGCQLRLFSQKMEENRTNYGKTLVFIHGVGKQVLKNEIIKILTSKYPHCYYCDARFDIFGQKGAIAVEILK